MSQSYIAVTFFGQVFHPENFNVSTMNKIYSFPLIKNHHRVEFVKSKTGIELSERKFLSFLEQLEYQLNCLNHTFDIEHSFDYYVADSVLEEYYEAGTDTNIFWEDEVEGGNIRLIVYPAFFSAEGLAETNTSKILAEYTISKKVYSTLNSCPCSYKT